MGAGLRYHLRFLVSKTVSSSLFREAISVESSVLARRPYLLRWGFFNLEAVPGAISGRLWPPLGAVTPHPISPHDPSLVSGFGFLCPTPEALLWRLLI